MILDIYDSVGIGINLPFPVSCVRQVNSGQSVYFKNLVAIF